MRGDVAGEGRLFLLRRQVTILARVQGTPALLELVGARTAVTTAAAARQRVLYVYPGADNLERGREGDELGRGGNGHCLREEEGWETQCRRWSEWYWRCRECWKQPCRRR